MIGRLGERLAAALRASGYDPSPDELAEILWLATQLAPSEASEGPPDAATESLLPPDVPEPPQQSRPPPASQLPDPAFATRPIHSAASRTAASDGLRASPIRLPVPTALPWSRELSRGLRALRSTVDSRTLSEIDIPATIAAIADGLPDVRLRPVREARFDLTLIVDDAESMAIWHDTVHELRMVLHHMHAFRRIRFLGLNTDLEDVSPSLTTAPFRLLAPTLSPSAAVRGGERSLVIVLTDGIGEAWHSGTALNLLSAWARRGPVAVWHLLPEALWPDTALSAERRTATAPRPGAPNGKIEVRPRRFGTAHDRLRLPLPVVDINGGASTSDWAHLVGAPSSEVVLPLTDAAPPPSAGGATEYEELPPADLPALDILDDFLSSATPLARRLAAHLACAPPITIPLMRLVQQSAVPGAALSHLAEVFLSGLLRPSTASGADAPLAERIPWGQRYYAFLPEAVDPLRELISRSAERSTNSLVARRLEHLAESREAALALISDPTGAAAYAPSAPELAWAKRKTTARALPDAHEFLPSDRLVATQASLTQSRTHNYSADRLFYASLSTTTRSAAQKARSAWHRLSRSDPAHEPHLGAESGEAVAMVRLGDLARESGDTALARTRYSRAADYGHTGAMVRLGVLAWGDGDTALARSWWTRAVDSGDADAVCFLGALARESGDTALARSWWTRAADSGDADAVCFLGFLAEEDGDMALARSWWTPAADNGDADAMYFLGDLARKEGEMALARSWWTRAADSGDADAIYLLGELAEEGGDMALARSWWTRAADNGDSDAIVRLGILAHEAGDMEGARTWWTRAADKGNGAGMYLLGRLAHEAGDMEGARTWWTRAADNGNAAAMVSVGILAHEAGDMEGARTWWTRAADRDNDHAMASLGILAHEEGDLQGARTWYNRAADKGNAAGMYLLGRLAREAGDMEGARSWWTRAADNGDSDAMDSLGILAHEAGDMEGARTWWTRAADRDNDHAMVRLGILAHEAGDMEGARTWWTRAADNGDGGAMDFLGDLAHEAGDMEGARTWWTRAADNGDSDAIVSLGRLAREAGDMEGARTWWTRAADRDNDHAMVRLGILAREAGDMEGARTWWTRAAENHDGTAMDFLGDLAHDAG
ncbi:SAV_2336 N-terminal domain-related protein, partial [Streptomyces microflavus]